MKRTFHLTPLMLVVFCVNCVNAQTDLPKIIQPSPTAAALFRFKDYPTEYSTGLPQINIPIYELKSGSLSVPISLTYHASGRRVSDQDGAVALGWVLNAGGMVSRTIYGAPDFGTAAAGTLLFPYPFKIEILNNRDDLKYLQKVTHSTAYDCGVLPWLDSEYDIFSYSFGNNSGKFLFKDINNVKTPALLPYKPYSVVPTFTAQGLLQISITDDKGDIYKFGASALYSSTNGSAVSNWSLSQIISADKVDTITFAYQGASERRTTISQSITLIDDWNMNGEAFPTTNVIEGTDLPIEDYGAIILSSITCRTGKILFTVSGTKINAVQIMNPANEIMKTVQFDRSFCYSLSEAGTSTNKLDAIQIKDKTGATAERYAFEYYPLLSSNGQINMRFSDWWGFYNNSGQPNMIPAYNNLQYIGSGGPGTINIGNSLANREPNLEALKSAVLKKIIYPTGGNTEFIYENNSCVIYGGSTTPRPGPGLRIAQIISSTGTGSTTFKSYKYGLNESGYGTIDMLPDITTMASQTIYGYMGGPPSWWTPERAGKYRQRTFSSQFNAEIAEIANRPVIYAEVAEYIGTTTSNVGKTVYNYDYHGWAPSAMPSLTSLTIPRRHIASFNYIDDPALTVKTDYRYDNGVYRKVKEETYNYLVTTTETLRGLHVQKVLALPQAGYGSAIPPGAPGPTAVCAELFALSEASNNPLGLGAPIYTFSGYDVPVGYKSLMSNNVTIWDETNKSVSTTTLYEYNNKQLLSKTTTTSSSGESLVKETKYPADFPSNPVLAQMVSLNMFSFPIEQNELNNTSPIRSTRTNYLNWGTTNPMFKPVSIDTKSGTGNYENRLRFLQYDNQANLVSVAKENDINHSYIWGYNKVYPIAEATNAKGNEIFFEGFEEGAIWPNVVGGWPDMSVDKSKTHSGRYAGKIYNPNSTELYYHSPKWLQVALTAPTKYKYSGWFYSDGPQIDLFLFMKRAGETGYLTYVDNTTMTATGKWVYLEKEFLVPADVVQLNIRVDNNGGNGTIWFDDIRLHPSLAKMTTYTYDPLIGVTSQSDINSRPSYYEYDAFGRLAVIRDQDNNVIKKICYNYAGQANTCAIFGNQTQSQTFTKSCTSGVGSQVSYTVAAGTYSGGTQSDANTLALNDIAANGQNYANLNGTCSAPVNVTINGVSYVNVPYYVQFYNVGLNQSYTMYVSAYGTASLTVPSGNYNVSFSPGGTAISTTYRINGYSTYGTSGSFSNIPITNGSQVVIGN